jgi:hypothetical protein
LNVIVEDPSIIIEKVDKDYKRYFFDDFSMGLLKRLTRERSRDDKVSIYNKNLKFKPKTTLLVP